MEFFNVEFEQKLIADKAERQKKRIQRKAARINRLKARCRVWEGPAHPNCSEFSINDTDTF